MSSSESIQKTRQDENNKHEHRPSHTAA
jgi:hypothetical protein